MTNRPKRVLVIDDDAGQLSLLRRVLQKAGFEVLTVDSPFGATNAARRFQTDVILLDVNMPAIQGDQLVAVLRKNVSLKGAPIILFSASDEDVLRSLAIEVGADGWLRKTFEGEALKRGILPFIRVG